MNETMCVEGSKSIASLFRNDQFVGQRNVQVLMEKLPEGTKLGEVRDKAVTTVAGRWLRCAVKLGKVRCQYVTHNLVLVEVWSNALLVVQKGLLWHQFPTQDYRSP